MGHLIRLRLKAREDSSEGGFVQRVFEVVYSKIDTEGSLLYLSEIEVFEED
jgi:hypothetical protein